MLDFLIFLYLWVFKISCSTELSMENFSFITSGPVSQWYQKMKALPILYAIYFIC